MIAAADMAATDRMEAFERVELIGLEFSDRYKLFSGAVIPRPIAFVSTLSEDGSANIAPFSSFMIASVEAGLLAFSVGPAPQPKRTIQNIRRSREFVINMVHEDLVHQVQACGEDVPQRNGGKLSLVGLSVIESEIVSTPRIAETKIQFECRLHRINRFGESHMVVGEVVLMHVQRGLLQEGRIDPLKYGALGRIAGRNYCAVREIVSV